MDKLLNAYLPAQKAMLLQEAKQKDTHLGVFLFGGDDGDRTHYLLNAIQALSQVSYAPTWLLVVCVIHNA